MSTVHPPLLVNVDDDDAGRYVKTRILRQAGFEVLEAATGEAGLRLAAERRPALMLIDVKLPDINGRELCVRIKSDPGMARIMVLQTSASHIEARHRVASLDAGADGYLVEPMEPEELVANVRALLRIRQAEDEREGALSELQEADRRKDEFLAMLAHELRNPLAPIRNAVEILRLSGDRPVRERARQVIARQVEHLSRLVDDLLEVSRITQRKVRLRRRAVRLATVVESAVEVARPLMDQHGQRFELALPAEDPLLDVDPVRMSQVIGNLLHNAAKFTPAGGRVKLEARIGGSMLEIVVSDDGVGISPEVLPRVFDLFSQGDRSLERSQGGLGIGLALVKRLVEMHGGQVSAHSDGPNRGSRFTITLPFRSARAGKEEPAAVLPAGRAARRILVVEDHQDSADALRMLLSEIGHEVRMASEGHEALDVARSFVPEVILLDIGLPGIDGYELARRLRELPETRDAHLVAVSGYGQQKDRERSAAAGFDTHLTKPVDPAKLTGVINAIAA